jgi:hypothetical protein
MIKVKWKVSSSSLVKRIRNDGGPPEETDSGSYKHCLAIELCTHNLKHTWMYSITLSSPGSLFALYLEVGNEFGEMFRRVRPRLFVMERAPTETAVDQWLRSPNYE